MYCSGEADAIVVAIKYSVELAHKNVSDYEHIVLHVELLDECGALPFHLRVHLVRCMVMLAVHGCCWFLIELHKLWAQGT